MSQSTCVAIARYLKLGNLQRVGILFLTLVMNGKAKSRYWQVLMRVQVPVFLTEGGRIERGLGSSPPVF